MEQLPPFELGDLGTELRRSLVTAVLERKETATSSLRSEYAPHTNDPLPRVGQRFRLIGVDGNPLDVVIQTTEVHVVPAGAVDIAFAQDEGEDFRTVAEWWTAHERFWTSHGVIATLTPETLVVCERFKVVDPDL